MPKFTTPNHSNPTKKDLNKSKLSDTIRNELDKIAQLKILENFPNLNKKIKIDTGKFCMARCNFCYYLDKVKNRDFITITEVLDSDFIPRALENGIRSFEFSGGEPTTCNDIPEIIEYILWYAKQLPQIHIKEDIKISIITNGIGLINKYQTWTRRENHKTIEIEPEYKNIDTIMFSLHGGETLHTKTTKVKSSYKEITDFIKYWLEDTNDENKHPISDNLKKYINLIRINVVVQPETFIKEDESIQFMKLLQYYLSKGIQVNLLPLNYWADQSNKAIDSIDYDKILEDTNAIVNGINLFLNILDYTNISKLNEIFLKKNKANILNIRYFQICNLSEENYIFKPYIINHFNHLFDGLDWNKLYYPNETQPTRNNPYGTKNNYNFKESNIPNQENYTKAFIRDANQSHFVDKVCLGCKEFLNLSCDGQKYINQQTKLVLESNEMLLRRKNYVNRK